MNIDLGWLRGGYFYEHDAFLACLMSYSVHLLSDLRTFLSTCFKIIQAFLKIISWFTDLLIYKWESFISGDFKSKLLWSVCLENLCLSSYARFVNIWRVKYNLSYNLVIWVKLNAEFRILACFS